MSRSPEGRNLTAMFRTWIIQTHRHCKYSNSLFVASPSSRAIVKKLWQHVLPDAEHLEWQDRRDSQQWSSGQGSGQPSPFLRLLLQQRLTALGFQTGQNSLLAELLGHAAEPNILLDWHSCLQKYTVSFSWASYLQTTSRTQQLAEKQKAIYCS